MTALPPNQRQIGMVFQAYALFPNMNVADNIAFGLKVARRPRAEHRAARRGDAGADRARRASASAFRSSCRAASSSAWRWPALWRRSRACCCSTSRSRRSTPRSACRCASRSAQIQRELGITTIFVTHDQEEALSISDRIVVMNAGSAEQIGTPFEIYNNPATRFVAGFVGTLNMLEAQVDDVATGTVRLGGNAIRLNGLPPRTGRGEKLTLAVRPEAVSLVNGQSPDIVLDGRVAEVSFLGAIIRIKVAVGEDTVSVDTFNDKSAPPPAHGASGQDRVCRERCDPDVKVRDYLLQWLSSRDRPRLRL